LLGLVSVCAIVLPMPALAPVMLPVMAPIVQLMVLATLAVKAMLVALPLQIDDVFDVVITGVGFTVTVIAVALPAQLPVVDVGVTLYCTVPAAALLGFVKAWLMVLADDALAPVMPPVIVPIVQLKVLAALAVNARLGDVPLQIDAVFAFVTDGLGFTVTVMV
jgi:hypothetical protein